MAKAWYIIHTYSGHENKVKSAVETKIRNLMEHNKELAERFGDIKIPTEEDPYRTKDGKLKVRHRKKLPGYVLINVELDDETWSIVKSTPGVTKFIGTHDSKKNKDIPKPLSEAEVYELLNEGQKSAEVVPGAIKRAPVEIRFNVGEHVKVIDGPFNNFAGVVEEVFPEKGRVRVKVEIFGRGTPVELDYLQVGKM
jgi:transcription termination/antitermination protein NusG